MSVKVAVVAGVCVRRDAISNVVRLQEQVLAEAGHEVRVYTHHTDYPSPDHVEVTDAWILQRDRWYREADVVIYHFGIQYGLFDALQLPRERGVNVVRFHNVTPADLLTGRSREQALKGIDQISIATHADEVWTDSEHNAHCLLEWADVDPARVSTMQLCVPWATEDAIAARQGRPHDPSTIRLIAVGRLVAAKGQHDLLDALALLPPEQRVGLDVELIGSLEQSDPAYIDRIAASIDEQGLGDTVRLALDLSDDELRSRFEHADVFVSPSHHEGFCVPVVEALVAGCAVVVTDAGALPDTLGPCGTVVPTADPAALASALATEFDALRSGVTTVSRQIVVEHLEQFSLGAFRTRLLDGIDRLVAGEPPAGSERLPAVG